MYKLENAIDLSANLLMYAFPVFVFSTMVQNQFIVRHRKSYFGHCDIRREMLEQSSIRSSTRTVLMNDASEPHQINVLDMASCGRHPLT